ncbi:MAG: hypothetical protein RSA57_03790 [Cetobacterium sp.]|uniref:hypothetical protein n=1 Tax=Bacteria TaxID=2 RepID=UPI002FC59456
MEKSYQDIEVKTKELLKKVRNNKSSFYCFITFFLFLGFMFFLNSNKIFNKDFDMMSTELNKKAYTTNTNLELKNREFNAMTGLVQFNLKVENKLILEEPIKVELREKSNPSKIIETNLVKLSDEDYVVYGILPKKWSAVSLTVTENNNATTSNNSIKFYSDMRDIKINNELVEMDKDSLNASVITNEISSLNEEINKTIALIADKIKSIKSFEEKVKTLEEDKKYQIDSEKIKSDSEIQNVKTSIETLRSEIKKLDEKKMEREKKIVKLEEKKSDIFKK